MRKQFIFWFIFYLSSVNAQISSYNTHSKPKHRRSRIADQISDFFGLKEQTVISNLAEKFSIENETSDSSHDCGSLDRIKNYFFKVYGDSDTLSLEDLDELIEFHIKSRRDDDNKFKHDKFGCHRDKVFNNFIFYCSILKKINIFLN